MSVTPVEGTFAIVPEPDWTLLLSDEIEGAAAGEHWRRITTEMKERELLALANAHSIQPGARLHRVRSLLARSH
ncbi:hypothetical protein HNO88_003981 [Novosphingobium chloroacetimidivorans]|uniref:Uncharacterized protein n=1 Tax=Novosphingobium chloroacetimidivorans TaxID=1428314 RepID=A0A7W7KD42_9SPHN|nr:hypothetical protein [Novosphingobium chloroacetimidivorans]MBB4860637.1 hypothetical protein [Novosphingobium chloroacetimidivorans]